MLKDRPRNPARSIALWLLLGLIAVSPAGAGGARIVPPEVLAAIEDDLPPPLPRSRAPQEWGLALPPVGEALAPPAGSVHTPAEYEPAAGLLIRWGNFNAELTAIAVATTTAAPPATVWVVVSGGSQQSSATSTLAGAGADMSRVAFLTAPTNSVWIRDYGPRFVMEDGGPAVVDHVYNRPRPADDAIPDFVATAWSLASYDLPLVHGGGNFHLFADGEAFMTELILNENSGTSPAEVEAYFADYENLDLTIWPPFPSSFDATQHIDMWMLPVRTRAAIVGEYAPATGTPHTVTEGAVAELATRGYTVWRTPGWQAGGTHYTYTNAVIVNRLVLIPSYSGYPTENAAAAATFAAAFPGYEIVPVDASDLVQFAGVFHCIVMHVPATALFADGFESGDLAAWSSATS